VLGEAAAVIEEQLIAADLDVHRRQARQAGVKRAGIRILRAAAFAEEDASQRLDRFLALNQRILALLDGSDPPVYSMSTHGENGIAAAGRAPVQARSSPAGQPGKTPAADRQFDPGRPPRPDALTRLDEVPGISAHGAQIILAEIGLDMTRFPTAGHLVSWAKLCPQTIQSGAKNRSGKAGKGNPYLKGILGEIATAAAKTDTFLSKRYRRIVKRRGKLKALVAVARTILVIIWHLLADPAARYHDLGAGYYASRIDTERKTRNHIRQLEALGYTVTLTQAA